MPLDPLQTLQNQVGNIGWKAANGLRAQKKSIHNYPQLIIGNTEAS